MGHVGRAWGSGLPHARPPRRPLAPSKACASVAAGMRRRTPPGHSCGSPVTQLAVDPTGPIADQRCSGGTLQGRWHPHRIARARHAAPSCTALGCQRHRHPQGPRSHRRFIAALACVATHPPPAPQRGSPAQPPSVPRAKSAALRVVFWARPDGAMDIATSGYFSGRCVRIPAPICGGRKSKP